MSAIGVGGNTSTRLPTRSSFAGYNIPPTGVSIPTRYVFYIGTDNSIQRVGTLGVEFAVVNPSDGQRYTFTGLLDSGSTQPVISSRIAEGLGVKLYPPVTNTSADGGGGGDYTTPLEILGLDDVFPVNVSIVPDYYPCLIPPRIFTRYYNLIFSSTDVVFTKRHPIPDGIPITQTKLGPFINVSVDGVNIQMIADTGSDDGSLTNETAAMLNVSGFPKLRTFKQTKGPITKTLIDYSVPLTIGASALRSDSDSDSSITYMGSMSVGVDAKSNKTDNVFPLEGLVQDGYRVELAHDTLKITPPSPSSLVL